MGAVITTLTTIALTVFSPVLDAEFWCKWIISYFYIKLFQRRSKKRFDWYDMMSEHDPYKVNFLPPPEEFALESPLPEDQLVNTADEVFCYGTSSKSEYLTVHVSRRPDNKSDAWIRLRLADGRTYELKETSGFQQSGCEKRVFSCGDLQMHYISPMRRWRIFFNGLMREKSSNNKSLEKMVYIKFALLWRASSDTFDFTTDVSAKDLATGLANAKWNKLLPPLTKLHSAMNIYTQAGVIFGNVSIEGDEKDHNMYLFGEKMRFLGDIHLAGGMELFQVLGRTTRDGRLFHLIEVSIANIVDKLRFGFMVLPTGGIRGISDATNAIEILSNNKEEKIVDTKFHVADDSELYELKGALVGEKALLQSNNDWSGHLTINHIDLQLNSFEGKGIILKGNMKMLTKRAILIKPLLPSSPVVPDVVHFSDKTCQNSELTGGKGSSLGKLTELSKELQNFVVPNGIVLTTAAYEKFLSGEVIQEIRTLENSLYSDKCDDIKAACQKVIEKVIESTIPEYILQEIISNLKKAFPDRKNTLKFAVRSSATGEDTEQMSAAGQMETYLGVSSIDEIMSSIKKCWASQFSHIAVQYKRQNGQLLNSPMAVVIQQMVCCDVAGVLFTCDPLTGNPTRISITANYGLGESVVSGSEEPDTIELRRKENDKLVVENKIIGSKRRRIVVKENNEGTSLEDVSEHERTICCLTDEMALRLGELAVKLQKSYRSHRDIEWGFWNNNLYIFQSRPVTSGTGESDFEIDHEQDAPMRIEDEYFTVCNVGEVMPGAMSPLGLDSQMKFFNIIFQRPRNTEWEFAEKRHYFPSGLCSMYSHVMFYCLDFFRQIGDKNAELGMITMFGKILEDEEMFETARIRFEVHKTKKTFSVTTFFYLLIRILFSVKRTLRNCQKTYSSYRFPVEKYSTAQDLFDALMYSCTDLSEAYLCHMGCSEASSIWIIFLFSFLRNVKGELNSDVYADFAQLLKTCSEVESADVPASLEELSRCISNDKKPEDFKKMATNEALMWLQSSTSKSGLKYREFLERHGHRCLREFDVRSKTWQTDPNSLVHLLKNTVGNVKIDKTENSGDFDTLVSKLITPLNFKQRLILKILLPLSRQSVQQRESSKSLLIRGVDEFRKGYTRLSQMMVSEGRIPDSDLLFFMTLEEIKELLHSRSPRIIAKANHRRRRYPTYDKYIFPEISKGVPIPINLSTQPIVSSDDSLLMKGIPVSQGKATGFARVAITLEEAAFLQPGEILVTYSTDIGWTPYFPLLAGVVTELGGLISHGAVVSREYGLPCVAGLHGATRQFQTGDYVLLDGTKGILQKLSKPDDL